MKHSLSTMIGSLTLLVLLSIAAACSPTTPQESPSGIVNPPVSATTLPETQTPTVQPPTSTPKPSPSPVPSSTPLPQPLDRFFLTYNPQATANIPIHRSVGFGIWGNEIPGEPVNGEPEFIQHAPPAGLLPLDESLLIQAGCDFSSGYFIDCSTNNTLEQFGCTSIYPVELNFEQQTGLALMGVCGRSTEDDELTPGDGIIISGCAFRERVGYLFQTGSGIVLVNDLEDLRQRFAPIESEAEAISYAQLATGLSAQFELAFSPYLVYLQSAIEDTWAKPVEGGYRVNLYHRPYCHCEPYVYSEISLQIDRDGTVSWLSVKPYAITTGFSCAD